MIKYLNDIDPLPPIGEASQPQKTDPPKPVVVAPGILRDAEGRLSTDLPEGKQAEKYVPVQTIPWGTITVTIAV